MKTKTIVTAILLSATGIVFASGGGGLSIDTVDVSNIKPTKAEVTEIKVQGTTIDQFEASAERDDPVDTSALELSYEEINLL